MEVLDYSVYAMEASTNPARQVVPGVLPARAIAHFGRRHHDPPNSHRYDLKRPIESWEFSERISSAAAAKEGPKPQ
jgi:hypothetical protein